MPYCDTKFPTVLFAYCCVDFVTYALGLYVIRRGGATLLVVTSAVATPLSELVFALPFAMGALVESYTASDGAALVLVLLGFGLFQWSEEETRADIIRLWRRAGRCVGLRRGE